MTEYPRLLVVTSSAMGGAGNTALTLSSLLDGWPPDRIGQVHTVARTTGHPPGNSFYLPPRSAPVDHFFRRLVSRAGSAVVRGAPTNAAIPAARRPGRARLHADLRAVADLSPLRQPEALEPWVTRFAPDVVYSMLASVRMMRWAERVADLAGAPLVPHFMDDWPSTLYAGGELFGLARRRMLAELSRVMRRAPLGLAISQEMAQEYSSRFGVDFETFGRCIQIGDRPPPGPDAGASLDVPSTLMYVGGLHLERWRTLARLAEGLDGLNASRPVARLVVHAPPEDLARFGPALVTHASVRIGGPLEAREVPHALAQADVLVHVESFDDDVRRFTRLSLSTKIPQYLAAGRSVLAIGPPELASMRLIESIGAGATVAAPDVGSIVAVVAALIRSPERRARMADRGLAVARERFCEDVVRARLLGTLTAAAAAPRDPR